MLSILHVSKLHRWFFPILWVKVISSCQNDGSWWSLCVWFYRYTSGMTHEIKWNTMVIRNYCIAVVINFGNDIHIVCMYWRVCVINNHLRRERGLIWDWNVDIYVHSNTPWCLVNLIWLFYFGHIVYFSVSLNTRQRPEHIIWCRCLSVSVFYIFYFVSLAWALVWALWLVLAYLM